MTIEYKDSKRIVKLSTDIVETPTYTYSSTGWTSTGGGAVATDNLTLALDTDGGQDQVNYDLTSISSDKFVLDFTLNFSRLTIGTNLFWFMGLVNSTNWIATNSTNHMGIFVMQESATKTFACSDGTSTWNGASEDAQSWTPTTGVDYYFRLTKLSSTTYKVELFSNPARTSVTSTSDGTVSSMTDLRYLVFTGDNNSGAGNATFTISDLKFYNGVSSTTNKPTDVQDNSLLIEKNTARRYWFDAESTSNVTWNDSTDVGCSISGNTITKTDSNGWTSGIGQTDQQISASNGGTITMTSNATNSFVGLSNVTSLNQQAKTWFDIKFGFADTDIIENGTQITPDTAFTRATSDTMKITISSAGLVKYYINDVLKHTSTITASGNYFGIFAAYTQNENMTATTTTPATWTMQPTKQFDFSSSTGWTTVGSNITITGGVIQASSMVTQSDNRIYYDLGSALSDKFVIDFDHYADTASSGGYWGMFALTDTTSIPKTDDSIHTLIDMGS